MLSRNEHHEVDCATELDSFQGCVVKSGPMVYMGNRFLSFFRDCCMSSFVNRARIATLSNPAIPLNPLSTRRANCIVTPDTAGEFARGNQRPSANYFMIHNMPVSWTQKYKNYRNHCFAQNPNHVVANMSTQALRTQNKETSVACIKCNVVLLCKGSYTRVTFAVAKFEATFFKN